MAAADEETGDEKLECFYQKVMKHILQRLFVARAGRKELFKLNFLQKQNNASYINALRHDITVLNAKKFHDLHAVDKKTNYHKSRFHFDQFLQKLIIYFSEHGGLAKEFYVVLKLEAERKPHKLLARPLAILAGKGLTTLLKTFDCDTKRRPKTALQSLSAALRANAHLSRPPLDLNVITWEVAGVKAVANVVSISPKKKREEMITKLITWKRVLRLGLAVTVEECTKYAIFKSLVALRPGTALKVFLKIFGK
ncbi:uncharacterized protein [Choristoneura fumiferana]|uniref:uncharacterized protein n=1 Tax=Choristoneura fumiferana TaxID=7141 RepID=UPI003D15E6FF